MPAKLDNFVGVLLSEETDDCLRLAALLQGVSKSALVRNLIIDKMDDNNWDEDSLIERYANTVYSQWVLRYKERSTFHAYLATVKYEIRDLPSDLLEKIMKKCRDLNQNQSKTK